MEISSAYEGRKEGRNRQGRRVSTERRRADEHPPASTILERRESLRRRNGGRDGVFDGAAASGRRRSEMGNGEYRVHTYEHASIRRRRRPPTSKRTAQRSQQTRNGRHGLGKTTRRPHRTPRSSDVLGCERCAQCEGLCSRALVQRAGWGCVDVGTRVGGGVRARREWREKERRRDGHKGTHERDEGSEKGLVFVRGCDLWEEVSEASTARRREDEGMRNERKRDETKRNGGQRECE